MTHSDRLGELLPSGFYVGDIVTYDTAQVGNVGVVVYNDNPAQVWATYGGDGGGETRAMDNFNRNGRATWMATNRTQLIRRYNNTNEGSTPMTEQQAEGNWKFATEPIEAGVRFRHFHDTANLDFSNYAYEGEMVDWSERTWRLIEGRTYGAGREGSELTIDCRPGMLTQNKYAIWVPVEVPVATDSAYDGTPGEFEAHNGNLPEPSTVVRGFLAGTRSRQVEGLFLRLDAITPEEATIQVKRRRDRRADGTFGEWTNYQNTSRRNINVEGAEVFKPGASAKSGLARRASAIGNQQDQNEVSEGMVVSARSSGSASRVYRGKVVEQDRAGSVTILATEMANLSRRTQTSGEYNWEKIPEQRVTVYCGWGDGRDRLDNAGWIWDEVGPGFKPVDPAYDPKRKTTHTGMGIGDLVVGLMRENEYGRDTVSSWVKGEIVKWDLRRSGPIVKITDKMESNKKVGDEVTLMNEDTYPAMADPSAVSPEEYKKTLRLYLIGRHKRGDFCRGGLNTMLAAHGIPLYETRRRAKMLITVDYDPNTTDLYAVRQQLQRGLTGVSGLSFDERSGEDIELAVESDVTQG